MCNFSSCLAWGASYFILTSLVALRVLTLEWQPTVLRLGFSSFTRGRSSLSCSLLPCRQHRHTLMTQTLHGTSREYLPHSISASLKYLWPFYLQGTDTQFKLTNQTKTKIDLSASKVGMAATRSGSHLRPFCSLGTIWKYRGDLLITEGGGLQTCRGPHANDVILWQLGRTFHPWNNCLTQNAYSSPFGKPWPGEKSISPRISISWLCFAYMMASLPGRKTRYW